MLRRQEAGWTLRARPSLSASCQPRHLLPASPSRKGLGLWLWLPPGGESPTAPLAVPSPLRTLLQALRPARAPRDRRAGDGLCPSELLRQPGAELPFSRGHPSSWILGWPVVAGLMSGLNPPSGLYQGPTRTIPPSMSAQAWGDTGAFALALLQGFVTCKVLSSQPLWQPLQQSPPL